MTPRTFWIVIIKIIGICIFYQLLTTVWQVITVTIAFSSLAASLKMDQYVESIGFTLSSSLIFLILYTLMVYFCISKTNWVINKLKLDEGYEDEKFEFNIHYSTVLTIVIIIIGGLLVVNTIAELIKEIFVHFNTANIYNKIEYNRNNTYIIADIFKLIIGLIMIFCNKIIIKFIDKKAQKNVAELSEE